MSGSESGARGDGERGQLVLLAAAVVAVALVPMLLAYVQLGYHGDVAASVDGPAPATDAGHLLHPAVHAAAEATDGEFTWASRDAATVRVNDTLSPRVERVEAARAFDGVAVAVGQNASAASQWASTNCPTGPRRRFGGCTNSGGIVVQERAGETALLAVAFDVHVNSTRRDARATTVVTVD